MKNFKKRISVTLDEPVVTKLKALRDIKALNVSAFVNKAVRAALEGGRNAQK